MPFLSSALDAPESWITYFAGLGAFVFFLAGVIGWGQTLSRRWLRTADHAFGLHLAVGSAGFSLWMGLAMLVLPAVLLKWLAVLGTVGGCALLRPRAYRAARDEAHTDRFATFLAWVLGASVVLRLIEGFHLHAHGDAFICYLTATRSWVEQSGFKEWLQNPAYFFSTSWEDLYLFGHLLFAQGGDTGLVPGQRFAQWCTAGIAHLGTIAIVYRFALELQASRRVALTAALAASTLPILRWTQNLAKNDLGVAFWALAGCYLIQRAMNHLQSSQRRPLLLGAGVLLGLAVIGKLSGFTILVPAYTVLLIGRARLKDHAAFALGGVIGAAPTMIRNLSLTGNPFFPWLETVFHTGFIGPSLTQNLYNLSHKNAARFDLGFLLEPFLQQPWLWAPVLLLVLTSVRRFRESRWEELRAWSIAVLLGAVAFVWIIRPKSELRYFGAGLELLSAIAIVALAAVIPLLVRHHRAQSWITGTLAALVLALSNLPFFTLAQVAKGKYRPGSEAIRQHSAGAAKEWLRARARESASPFSIVTLGDNEEYYMLPYRYHEMGYYQPLDRVIGTIDSGPDLTRFLRDAGYRYVVDARSLMAWGYLNRDGGERLMAELGRFPKAKVFEEGGVAIYDLSQLWAVAAKTPLPASRSAP